MLRLRPCCWCIPKANRGLRVCARGHYHERDIVLIEYLLVPLDGSPLADQILPYVRLLGHALNVPVRLLHVDRAVAAPDETVPHFANAYLERAALTVQQAGLTAERQIVAGAPADAILAYVQQHPFGLVMMATHGYSGLRQWALGSVTDRVVSATSAPVFVVRATTTPQSEPQLQHLLVPLDGSSSSDQALPIAGLLARYTGAHIHLLSAVFPVEAEIYDAETLTTNQRIQSLLPLLQQERQHHLAQAAGQLDGLTVSAQVVVGKAVETIIAAASKQPADLIVMATHGYSGFRRWALGSVANEVLRTTDTPLLLVRVE